MTMVTAFEMGRFRIAMRLAVIGVLQTLLVCPLLKAEIPLPTPREHYQKFPRGTTGLALLSEFMQQLDPATQKMLGALAQAGGLPDPQSFPKIDPATTAELLKLAELLPLPKTPPLSKPQVVTLLKQINWTPWRVQILEFFIHQSQVLDMIPERWGTLWGPIVHDALLYFLDHQPEDRLAEKFVNLAYLPPGTSRGTYLLEFVSRTPSLQKLGQILARNPDLALDYREALQRLENGIQTTTRDELVEFITQDVGREAIEKYQVKFANKILAEASVAAVIRASCVLPGTEAPRDAICKVIKPYVLVALPQDLTIVDGLAGYFTRQHDYYQLGSMPLSKMFQEIRRSLSDEIKTVEEQHNLVRAREYYRDNPRILVPELLPLSTRNVTTMEFVHGHKIANSFPGDARQRALMARRFFDALTFDVIYSPKKEALFHGDPHSGNVFHVVDDKDPYRIALLDWGLCGTFPREERRQLVQLMLGVQIRDARRLRNNVDALLEHGLPKSPGQLQRLDAIIAEVLKPKRRRSNFDVLADLLFALIQEGYATRFNLNLFIKSQVTIAGILQELDPNLNQDQYLEKRIAGLVKREFPKRFLCTLWFPAWNSRNYRSMLSNQDVKDKLSSKSKPGDKPPRYLEHTQKAGLLEPNGPS